MLPRHAREWQTRIGSGCGAGSEPLADYVAVAFRYQYRSSAVAVTLGGREISTIDLIRTALRAARRG